MGGGWAASFGELCPGVPSNADFSYIGLSHHVGAGMNDTAWSSLTFPSNPVQTQLHFQANVPAVSQLPEVQTTPLSPHHSVPLL